MINAEVKGFAVVREVEPSVSAEGDEEIRCRTREEVDEFREFGEIT